MNYKNNLNLPRGVLLTATMMVMALSGASSAADFYVLAKSNACMSCHSVDKKIVGPAFRDVAARYRGKATAKILLVSRVKAGSKGVWGQIPMPPNPQVNDEDMHTLISWVLSLEGGDSSNVAAEQPESTSSPSFVGAILTGVAQGMAQRNAQRGVVVPSPSTSSSSSALPSSPPIQTYPSNQNSSSTQNTAQSHGEPVNCLEVVANSYGAPQFHNRCNFTVRVSYCTTEGSCRCRTNPISSECADGVGAGRDIAILGSGHVYSAQCNGNTKYSLPSLKNGKQSCN